MDDSIKLNFKSLILASAMSSLVVNLGVFLSMCFGEGIVFQYEMDLPKPPPNIDGAIASAVANFIMAIIFFSYAIFISNRKINKVLKTVYVILGTFMLTLALSPMFTWLRLTLFERNKIMPCVMIVDFYRNGFLRDYILSIVVAMTWQLIVASHRKNEIAVKNEILVADNIRARFETLKNQVNPHFLFNSLNTLQYLIPEDSEKAESFLQELSKVLRYTLQNKECVSLAEEMNFVNSYCNLMQIRYGNNLAFDIKVDNKYLDYLLMPLSIQILIENAIKHNVISSKKIFVISVFSDDSGPYITVKNEIIPKIGHNNSTNGIGLSNLSERYRLKWNKDIEITKKDNYFKVNLFLIKE